MSDEDRTPAPDEEPISPDDQSAGAGGDEPESESEASSAPEAAGDQGPEAAADPDPGDAAARALAAAQAAIADAMGGADADATDGEEPTPEELEMLAAMQQAVSESTSSTAQVVGSGQATGEAPTPFTVPTFAPSSPAGRNAEMELLGDVNVDVRIELGRTRMLVEDVLRLGEGAVVELEKLAGDPVDVYVNGRHVARGEVLVLNESFCVRVNEVLEPLPTSRQTD